MDDNIIRLMGAAVSQDSQRLNAVLSENGDINRRFMGSHGDRISALHILASMKENKDAVEFLVRHGADVNCRSSKGFTPIHVPAFTGHLEMVDLLLKLGADPNVQNYENGWSLLHDAASEGHSEIIMSLIRAGANRHVKDHVGATPMMIAIHGGHQYSANILRG